MSDPQHACLRQKLHVSMIRDPAAPGKKHRFLGDSKFMGALRKAYMTKAGSGVDFPKRGIFVSRELYLYRLLFIIYIYNFQHTYYLRTCIYIRTHFGRSRFFPFFWFFQTNLLNLIHVQRALCVTPCLVCWMRTYCQPCLRQWTITKLDDGAPSARFMSFSAKWKGHPKHTGEKKT